MRTTLCLTALLALAASGPGARAAPPTLHARGPIEISFGGKVKGLHLNSATFTSTIHKGAWLIEYYSPMCGHCRKFEPTWDDVAKMSTHLEDSADFHMARVDCIAQGDLCKENAVRYFPTVRLHFDGKVQNEYKGDRSYADLTSYVTAKAADYRAAKAKQLGIA